MSYSYTNIKNPIRTYTKCGTTVKVYKDKEGKLKTRTKVNDNRYHIGNYSWLSEILPCENKVGTCGRKCQKRRKKTKKSRK